MTAVLRCSCTSVLNADAGYYQSTASVLHGRPAAVFSRYRTFT